jgi:hypothetical protein
MKRKHVKTNPKAKEIVLPPDACIPCGVVFGVHVALMCKDKKRRTAK